MNVLESYPLPPGTCWLCRSSREGLIIDTLRDIEEGAYDHRVYLCEVCVGDMWSKLIGVKEGRGRGPGLVPASRLDIEAATNAQLHKEIDAYKAALLVGLPALQEIVPLIRPPETEPPGATPAPKQPESPDPNRRAA